MDSNNILGRQYWLNDEDKTFAKDLMISQGRTVWMEWQWDAHMWKITDQLTITMWIMNGMSWHFIPWLHT